MAIPADVQALLTQMDTATTAVGSRIAALVAQIAAGMSPADVADLKTKFQAEVDNLTALAADPNNPVPPPVTAKPKP